MTEAICTVRFCCSSSLSMRAAMMSWTRSGTRMAEAGRGRVSRPRDVGVLGEAGPVRGAPGQDQEDRLAGEAVDQLREVVLGGAVHPLEILDHKHHRSPLARPACELADGAEHAGAAPRGL